MWGRASCLQECKWWTHTTVVSIDSVMGLCVYLLHIRGAAFMRANVTSDVLLFLSCVSLRLCRVLHWSTPLQLHKYNFWRLSKFFIFFPEHVQHSHLWCNKYHWFQWKWIVTAYTLCQCQPDTMPQSHNIFFKRQFYLLIYEQGR